MESKALATTPCIKNCYIWFKLKLVASLQTSEFPLEIPRLQNRNFPYKTTLPKIAQSHWGKNSISLKFGFLNVI
tara:strand:- start:483 stop:704 length:222 start_codon:yes stop_codon:yes gene_type:complete